MEIVDFKQRFMLHQAIGFAFVLAEIGFNHLRIVADFLVRSLRDDFAEVQHINFVANLLDQRHIVFDHQHAQAVAAQTDDLLTEFVRLNRIHARRRLIQQNQLRLNCQRARHL